MVQRTISIKSNKWFGIFRNGVKKWAFSILDYASFDSCASCQMMNFLSVVYLTNKECKTGQSL